jgi:small-conductance mechanosensitive channel
MGWANMETVMRPRLRAVWLGPALPCFLLALFFVFTAHAQDQHPTAQKIVQAPVVLNGKTIFEVPGLFSFSAEARAAAITDRIKSLSKDTSFDQKSLVLAESEGSTDILAGDLVLMSITDQDAHIAGKPRNALAQDDLNRIGSSLVALHRAYSVKSLTLAGVYSLLATVLLILLFRGMGIFFPKFYRQIELWRGTVIPSLRIQKFEILPADRIADFAIGLSKLLRLGLVLVVMYFYAYLVLGFFPWTRGYASILVGYILSPLRVVGDAVLAYLPNFFFIAVIIFVSHYFIKFTQIFFVEIGKGTVVFSGFHRDWAQPTYKIVRFLILAVTAIAVFPYLPGAKSPAFQGISIFLGVLFSLGSTSAVANIVAGVILTYMRAFRLGDRVQIADTVGDVVEVSLLVTRIRTIKNVEITIANSMVLSSHIINFSGSVQEDGLILHTTVTIGYDVPWRKIHELLMSAASTTQEILSTPPPFVLQTALDDFYVHYQINAYTDQPRKMSMTYSYLHQNIQDKFFEAGVEIMSPHFSTIRDGNRVAIPDDYLPKDYRAPAFRVEIGKDFEGTAGGTTKSDDH